jgi:hypothetical protein
MFSNSGENTSPAIEALFFEMAPLLSQSCLVVFFLDLSGFKKSSELSGSRCLRCRTMPFPSNHT